MEKEIEVTGRQERASMQGGAWGVTGRYGYPQGAGLLGGIASGCVRCV